MIIITILSFANASDNHPTKSCILRAILHSSIIISHLLLFQETATLFIMLPYNMLCAVALLSHHVHLISSMPSPKPIEHSSKKLKSRAPQAILNGVRVNGVWPFPGAIYPVDASVVINRCNGKDQCSSREEYCNARRTNPNFEPDTSANCITVGEPGNTDTPNIPNTAETAVFSLPFPRAQFSAATGVSLTAVCPTGNTPPQCVSKATYCNALGSLDKDDDNCGTYSASDSDVQPLIGRLPDADHDFPHPQGVALRNKKAIAEFCGGEPKCKDKATYCDAVKTKGKIDKPNCEEQQTFQPGG